MSGYQRMLDRVTTDVILKGMESKRKEKARERVLKAFEANTPEQLLDKMKAVRDKEARSLQRKQGKLEKAMRRKGIKMKPRSAGITDLMDDDQPDMTSRPIDEAREHVCRGCGSAVMHKNAAWNAFQDLEMSKPNDELYKSAVQALAVHCQCEGKDYKAYEARWCEAAAQAVLESHAAMGDAVKTIRERFDLMEAKRGQGVEPKPMPGDGYPVQEPEGFKGKKNVYTCPECGNHIVTVDRDDGTTPFLTMCKADPSACRGMMQSAFYRVDQSLVPSHEWYKPDDVSGETPAVKEHVRMGGLLLREIDG